MLTILSCTVVKCPDYVADNNYTIVECSNTTYTARCNLGCNAGYTTSYVGAPSDPVCQADGTWSAASGCVRMHSICLT